MPDAMVFEGRGGDRCATFEDLIAPLSLETFRERYWRKRPLLLRASRPGRFDPLFTVRDIDMLLPLMAASPDNCLFIKASEDVALSDFEGAFNDVRIDAMLAHYREGGTLQLRNIQNFMPSLDGLWRDLTIRNRAQVKVNFWQTRHNQREPYLHFDTHDIFVAQIHGEKRWKIYEHSPALFSSLRGSETLTHEEVGEVAHDVVLRPGDLLYMPAGTPHEVTTCSPHVVHLAFGVFPVVWHDLLTAAYERLRTRGSTLNEAVPLDLLRADAAPALGSAFREALAGALAAIPDEALEQDLAAKFLKVTKPPRDDFFSREIMGDRELTAQDPVRRRGNLPCRVVTDMARQTAAILFGGGGMEGPIAIAPLLDFIARTDGAFCAADLPDDFELDGRTTVVDELVGRGLLARSPHPSTAPTSRVLAPAMG